MEISHKLWRNQVTLDVTSMVVLTHFPGFLEQNSASLVSLILDTLPFIVNGKSRSAVDRVLHRCLKSESFFKMFAGALVKHGMQLHGKSESHHVLKWIALLLSRLSLPESQKPVSKLLHVAAHCMDQLMERDFKRASQRLRGFVTKSLGFRQEAMAVAADVRSPTLLRLVCETLTAEQDPTRERLLMDYCTNVLGAKSAPGSEIAKSYRSLLGRLTKNEFGDVVLPTLTRSLRRNPELVLPLTDSLFCEMHLDVSAFGMELLKVMLQFIRHTSPAVQTAAVEVQSHVSKLISDRDIIQQMAQTLEGILSGKQEGRIKSIQERIALAKTLGVLSVSPAKRNDLSLQVSTLIGALYENEGT